MNILVTGAAGFIGHSVCRLFLTQGHTVTGIDNLNDYYSPQLKLDRLAGLRDFSEFTFVEGDISDNETLVALFKKQGFTHVINLAAQAGVRYSLINPASYVQSNLIGFANILEACRNFPVEHLVYASSSSVYGLNTHMPFSTKGHTDHPVSLYAATKKSNEMMAHSYSHLYGIAATGLRFFTVYGPWGRPDMALFIFTKAILEGRPIPVFNEGRMKRDFTYIDDIVNGVASVTISPAQTSPEWDAAQPDPSISSAPHRIYNIGNNEPVELRHFISAIEKSLGIKAELDLLPMQPGDVTATYADIDDLQKSFGFAPAMPLEQGVQAFVDWYREYYHI